MSQSGIISVPSGTLPPTVATTYVTDSGNAVPAANILNVLGQYANTTPVMFTSGTGSTLSIENRAWQTQYVVDPHTTQGLRGTFITIQAAIDQCVADKASGYNYLNYNIAIRSGYYYDDIVLPRDISISFIGMSDGGQYTQHNFLDVSIVGNISIVDEPATGQTYLSCYGIQFLGQITFIDAISALFENCYISDLSIGVDNGGSATTFVNCKVQNYTCNATAYTNSIFTNCNFINNITLTGDSQCQVNSSVINTINVSDTSYLKIYDCTFVNAISNSVSPFTGTVEVYDCVVATSYVFNFTGGTLYYSNLTVANGSSASTFFGFLTPDTIISKQHYGGNVKNIVTTTVDYEMTDSDMYVGVESTTVPITITLPTTPFVGQQFEIKDALGQATALPISIVGTTEFITPVVINQRFGYKKFRWNGTYFIEIDSTATSPLLQPGSTLQLVDDFVSSVDVTVGASLNFKQSALSWAGSITNRFYNVTSVQDHPGLLGNPSIALNSAYLMLAGQDTATTAAAYFISINNSDNIRATWYIRRPTASNVTNRYILRFGLGDTVNADQVNGMYFEYSDNINSAQLVCKTSNSSSRTTVNTSSAIGSATYRRYDIIYNSDVLNNTVTFYFDGAQVAQITTDIPVSAAISPFVDIARTAGTIAANSILVDLFDLTMDNNSRT